MLVSVYSTWLKFKVCEREKEKGKQRTKMVRSPSVDKNGIKRGAWSEEEDNKLRAYVQRYGHWNWRQLPKFAGLARCGKSCRLRWLNYLRPGLKKGRYSKEEEELIIKLQEKHGNKWSSIAAKLPGRTDNEIKNYWHTYLKKRVKQDPKSTEKTSERFQNLQVMDQKEQASAMSISESTDQKMESDVDTAAADASNEEIQSSSYDSTLLGGAKNTFNSEETFSKFCESFWNEPFFTNTSYNQMSSYTSCNSTVLSLEDWLAEYGISLDESFVKSSESFSAEPSLSDASNGLISPSISCNSTVTNSEESSADAFGCFWTEPFSLDTSYNQSIHQSPPVEEGLMLPFTPFLDYDVDLFTQF